MKFLLPTLLVMFVLSGCAVEPWVKPYERDRLAHPSARLGNAQEVANVAVFTCSPAASWVNGENIVVDGGFTKRVGF